MSYYILLYLIVADYLGDRTSNQCLNRWEKSLNPSIKRGKWSQKEDEVAYISALIICFIVTCLQSFFHLNWVALSVNKYMYNFFNKQLGSGLSPQSCLYFQDFQGLILLNGCVVV